MREQSSAVWMDEKMVKKMERHLALRWVDQRAARLVYQMDDLKDAMSVDWFHHHWQLEHPRVRSLQRSDGFGLLSL